MASETTNEYREQLESQPDPSTISAKIMAVAEKITWKEVLFRIHPTWDEFEKRAGIILFLQTMVTHSFEGIQVISFSIRTFLRDFFVFELFNTELYIYKTDFRFCFVLILT